MLIECPGRISQVVAVNGNTLQISKRNEEIISNNNNNLKLLKPLQNSMSAIIHAMQLKYKIKTSWKVFILQPLIDNSGDITRDMHPKSLALTRTKL